jgi:hypothetical protein
MRALLISNNIEKINVLPFSLELSDELMHP